jgi:hypothetical protein
MFEKDVETKNGVTKHVIAHSQEELDEAVQAVKAEHSAPAPNILDPRDGNKIVSPDNKHTEDIPSVVDNNVEPVKKKLPKNRLMSPSRRLQKSPQKPSAAQRNS